MRFFKFRKQKSEKSPSAPRDALSGGKAREPEPSSPKCDVIAELEREGLTINWRYGYKLANRYEVKRVCSGGQAVVYIVEDLREKGKRYAAKSLKEYFRKPKTEEEWKRRNFSIKKYLEECNIWVGLGKHRQIVQAEYLEKIEDVPLVMSEFINGGGLDDWLKKGRLDMTTALDYAIQSCIGMEYANKKGVIIHRDIKPGNIMVTMDGVAKVNDFGLAKAIESTETIRSDVDSYATLDSASLNLSRGSGTPLYMAPEQFPKCLFDHLRCPSPPLGIEADIYAFGLVLYEMITGTPVIKIVSDREMEIQRDASYIAPIFNISPGYVYCFLKALKANPPPPSKNKRLNAVIMKCLEKIPSERYHSFSELRKELVQIYSEETGRHFHLVEEPPHETNWRNMGKTYWVLGREKESFECYDKALERNPVDTLAWLEKGLASAETGDLSEFGLCMEIIAYLSPDRKEEVQEHKEMILNETHIRPRDIRLFERINRKYATSAHTVEVRDDLKSKVVPEFTDPFREPNPVIAKRLSELKSRGTSRSAEFRRFMAFELVSARGRAVEELGKLGDKSAVPALIEALKDEDLSVIQQAAEALGKLGDKSAVPALIEALKHQMPGVKHFVVQTLGKLGDKSAVPALIEALKHDSSVGWQAAEALGKLGDKSAVPALIKALKNKNSDVRRYGAEALGKLGDKSAVPALIKALKDNDHEVRKEAVWALGKLGDKSAVPALIESRKDENSSVRYAAVIVLSRLGDKSAMSALIEGLNHKYWEERYFTAAQLIQFGDKSAVPALIKALKDENFMVRQNVVRVLNRFVDKSAVPALIEALKDDDPIVCWNAAEALGKLGDKSAVPALIEALKYDPLKDEDNWIRRRIAAEEKAYEDAGARMMPHKGPGPKVSSDAKGVHSDMVLSNAHLEAKHIPKKAAEAIGKLADEETIPRLLELWTLFPDPRYIVVALRWVCSQPNEEKLSKMKERVKAYSAFALNKEV